MECSHVGRTNGSIKGKAVKIRVESDGRGFYAKSLGFLTKAVELIKGFKARAVGKALWQLRWVEVRKVRRAQEEQEIIATFQVTENMRLNEGSLQGGGEEPLEAELIRPSDQLDEGQDRKPGYGMDGDAVNKKGSRRDLRRPDMSLNIKAGMTHVEGACQYLDRQAEVRWNPQEGLKQLRKGGRVVRDESQQVRVRGKTTAREIDQK